MSSLGGQMSFVGFAAYSGTKFALEGVTEASLDEVRPLGIKALIVEPGAFRTSLMSNGLDRVRARITPWEIRAGTRSSTAPGAVDRRCRGRRYVRIGARGSVRAD